MEPHQQPARLRINPSARGLSDPSLISSKRKRVASIGDPLCSKFLIRYMWNAGIPCSRNKYRSRNLSGPDVMVVFRWISG